MDTSEYTKKKNANDLANAGVGFEPISSTTAGRGDTSVHKRSVKRGREEGFDIHDGCTWRIRQEREGEKRSESFGN